VSRNPKPLEGKTILVTRSRKQAGALSQRLREAGAAVVEIPTIAIRPLDPALLDHALGRLDSYDWVLFTSANGVDLFFDRYNRRGRQPELPPVCVIGPGTAERVRNYGGEVALHPEVFQAEGVVEAFLRRYGADLKGVQILLPRAHKARDLLPSELERLGATVDLVPIYETVVPAGSREELQQLLHSQLPDLVTLTSSSTAGHFAQLVADDELLGRLRFAAIGPVTEATARGLGMQVVCVSSASTIPGLVDAIVEYFGRDAGHS
jgi:uroporphyrinogen III methyltransferase/synthase